MSFVTLSLSLSLVIYTRAVARSNVSIIWSARGKGRIRQSARHGGVTNSSGAPRADKIPDAPDYVTARMADHFYSHLTLIFLSIFLFILILFFLINISLVVRDIFFFSIMCTQFIKNYIN